MEHWNKMGRRPSSMRWVQTHGRDDGGDEGERGSERRADNITQGLWVQHFVHTIRGV